MNKHNSTLKNDDNSLTKEGEKIAKYIVSKHRIWEDFLVDVLKLSWKTVDKQAHLLRKILAFQPLNIEG